MNKEEYKATEQAYFKTFEKNFIRNGLITIAGGLLALSLNLGIEFGKFKYIKEIKKDPFMKEVYRDVLAKNWNKIKNKNKFLSEHISKIEDKFKSFDKKEGITYGLGVGSGLYFILSFVISDVKYEKKKKNLEEKFNEFTKL